MNDNRRRLAVSFSPEFEARLADIERHGIHVENFDRLLDLIDEKLVPLLERFPTIGRRLFNSAPDTVDALLLAEELEKMNHANEKEGGELHEHLSDDYVFLYRRTDSAVTLLTVRPTVEISIEFTDLWGGEP